MNHFRHIRRSAFASLGLAAALAAAPAAAQTANQPKVQPGPNEPDWIAILDAYYGLSMFGDLLNPAGAALEEAPCRFRKAGPGPVSFTPVMALGLEVTIRGGWYVTGFDPATPRMTEVWSYQHKHTARDLESGKVPPVPLREGRPGFDPGGQPFGLWIGNDQFKDAVFSQPVIVRAANPRLAGQPYKAMIYPFKDKATGKVVPNSYLIGWEYSTNDDFQDVVCRVDNVELVR